MNRMDGETARGCARAMVLAAVALAASPAHAALVVSKGATTNVNCAAGICTATAQNAILNVKDLRHLLGTSDVTLVSGATAMDIELDTAVSWIKSHRLTLDAYRSIAFTKPVTVEGTGGVTLITDDGGSGGDLGFAGKGQLTFWDTTSSLIVNGNAYTLVDDIATLAADITANPSGFYALAKDYDASGDRTYSASPISTTFTGVFEGLGHAVANLSIRVPAGSTSSAGFFSTIAGSVQDFGLTQGYVSCGDTATLVGLLAAENQGTINNAFADGSVDCSSIDEQTVAGGLVGFNQVGTINRSRAAVTTSGFVVGGLAGENGATISNSFATGSVQGEVNSYAGGLVGNNSGAIDSSHATGAVNASSGFATGGLVGQANPGNITHSYATGNVAGKHYAGGLIGLDETFLVDGCYATGTVSGETFVGGLLGGISSDVVNPTATNSYATGAVSGGAGAYVGAFIGEANKGTLQASYATGSVTGGKAAGGFIGVANRSVLQHSYWDLDTTGIGDPSGGAGNRKNYTGIVGLTDVQLKSQLPSGFDPSIWARKKRLNNGYPYLLTNLPPG